MTLKKTAVVTGGSSGIGLETCRALAENGYRVYELSRHDTGNSFSTHINADISNEDQVNNAVQMILNAEDHIDLLVNNAGTGISGAVEFTDTEDAKRLFEINFFGMVRMCRAVIPSMRTRGKGLIINISSMGAPAPLPFQAFYSASKSAVNTYTLAAINELRPYGVKMCCIQPGDVHTGFTDARSRSSLGDDIYKGRISRSVSKMEQDERNGMDPAKIGMQIVKIARSRKIRPLYCVDFISKAECLLIKLFPTALFNRIIYSMYAK